MRIARFGEPAEIAAVGGRGPDVAQVGEGDLVLMDVGIADQTGLGGGLQQQRHPGLQEQQKPVPDRENAGPEADIADDPNVPADQRAMEQARSLNPAVRAHALNESGPHDLVPGL